MKATITYCDKCSDEINAGYGMVDGHYNPLITGLKNSDDVYKIFYTNLKGNNPDLCQDCLKKELTELIKTI